VGGDDHVDARVPTHLCGAHTELAEGAELNIEALNEKSARF